MRRAALVAATLAAFLTGAALAAAAVTAVNLHRIEHAQDGTD